MRLAQTAGYGVLPNPEIPFSFFAQAGDLEDVWGPAAGPCFSGLDSQWECCSSGNAKHPNCKNSGDPTQATHGADFTLRRR